MKQFFQRFKKNSLKTYDNLKPQAYMPFFEKAWRSALVGIIGVFLLGLTYAIIFFLYALITIPNPFEAFRDVNLTESTLIMDRAGNTLYAIHGEENRESLDTLSQVSPWLIDATIAIEDDQFYHHIGMDVPGIAKAVLAELGIGEKRGGSTITQQFARNFLLNSERTYKRKLQEIILSLIIELRFSKDDVLLMYLNAIPYGSNAYGIQLASEKYFNKDAKDLNLAESAVLASIPNAPTRYSPYGNYRYSTLLFEPTAEYIGSRKIKDENDLENDEWVRGLIGKTYDLPNGAELYLRGRSDLVLERMNELGYIDETEMQKALADIQILEFTPYKESIKAPHFVLWVKSLLEQKYGAAVVEQGGLKVYTTLEPDMQKAAEKAVADKKEANAKNFKATDAALVSIQPTTGQILAMVGSADYFDDTIDGQVNIITAPRAPGSSFKPFIYALAFLNGYSPATVLYDVETKFGTDTPQNYSGTFNGPVSIRYALGHSLNIPAIKAYFLAGQEDKLVPFIHKFGFDSIKDNGNYGYPLALGAAEVTPLEHAAAFSVLANAGVKTEITPFLRIENADGDILEQWEEKELKKEQVLDPQVAFLINDILSDGSVGLGGNIRIEALDNAAKTGTSNTVLPNGNIAPNNCWIAAYTPSFVTVVWTGNANGDPMSYNADGYTIAAPIWKQYTSEILGKFEPTIWPRPEEIKDLAISKASGKLPNASTPSNEIATEVFASWAVPTEVDDSFKMLKIETISNRLATEYSPEEFVEEKPFRVHKSILADIWPTWQAAVDKWVVDNEIDIPPTEEATDIHNAETAANVPSIIITSPNSLSKVSGKTVEIEVDVQDVGNGFKEIIYLVDDNEQYHADDMDDPDGKIRIPSNVNEGDEIRVTAKIYDKYGYSGESTIELRISSEPSEPEED